MIHPYTAMACPVTHSPGALQRKQALGGPQVTNIELCMGKRADGSFFSFAKCAYHEVRDKVPSEIMPTPLPPLTDPKVQRSMECLSLKSSWADVIQPPGFTWLSESKWPTQRWSEVEAESGSQLSFFPILSEGDIAEWLKGLNQTLSCFEILLLFYVNPLCESRSLDLSLIGEVQIGHCMTGIATKPHTGRCLINAN